MNQDDEPDLDDLLLDVFETEDCDPELIVRYDEVPTFRYGHVLDLLSDTEHETSVPIEVKRDGDILELTLTTGPPKPPHGQPFGLRVTRDRQAPDPDGIP